MPVPFFPTSFSGLDGHAPFTCSALADTFEVLDPLELLAFPGSFPFVPDAGMDVPVPPLQATSKRTPPMIEGATTRRETERERIDIGHSS